MDKNAIAERLRALATDSKNRSKAAQLRDVITDVEAALAAGVSRIKIVEVLAENGLEMTLATFETTLKRIRKKNRSRPAPAKQTQTNTTRKQTDDESELIESGVAAVSHNPADIDAIVSSNPNLEALAKLSKKDKKR